MTNFSFRPAIADDLPRIIALLTDDVLGATRERGMRSEFACYEAAFAEISADPNQLLCVAEKGGQVVGTLQLSFIPGLARGGAKRGQIEAVRIAAEQRGQGIGKAMFDWAIGECRARGCALVQLTSDTSRTDAHLFYERLGFVASHIGYKLAL